MSIGIDLGTTFSCVAHYQNGQVNVLENDNGNRTTPTVLAMTEEGECIIGQHAKDMISEANTLFDVKRIIGRRYDDTILQRDIPLWPFRIDKDADGTPYFHIQNDSKMKKFSAVTISSLILKSLKENAERKTGVEVKSAVITVPAYFNAAQRRATEEASEMAGLKVLRILNEPTAAAIAYSLKEQRFSRRNILIYDLGGGTFDVAVVNVEGPRITVKAKGGDTHLGGQDIDNIVMSKMMEEFKQITGQDCKENSRALRRIRKSAEAAKITLSAVGGSTRIPLLKKIIRSSFDENTKICETIHPDEAVAHGAAVMAAVLTGVEEVQDMRLIDMIPMSIGVQCNRDYMSVLIKKGSIFPCSKTKTFINSEDHQTHINVPVYEGERAICSHNRQLGEITLSIDPKKRGESVVDITLEVDHNGILQATALDLNTKKVITTTIVYDHCTFTQPEIEQITHQSEEDRLFDETFRSRYKQLQKSEDMAYDYKHRLEKIKGSVDPQKFSQLMEIIEQEISWLSSFPKIPPNDYLLRRRALRLKVYPTLFFNLSFY